MKPSRVQRSYEEIRQRLVEGTFPPGSRLDYSQLAVMLGVSTTPIREAVGQLASEGFVEIVPRIGAVVKQLDRHELIELYEAREAIESFVAFKAARTMSDAELSDTERHVEAMDEICRQVRGIEGPVDPKLTRAFLYEDLEFHMSVIGGAHNRQLTRLAGYSQVHHRIFSASVVVHDSALFELTNQDHRAILNALRAHDPEAAREHVVKHIHTSLEMTLRACGTGSGEWWRR